jgi:hypothetical protein
MTQSTDKPKTLQVPRLSRLVPERPVESNYWPLRLGNFWNSNKGAVPTNSVPNVRISGNSVNFPVKKNVYGPVKRFTRKKFPPFTGGPPVTVNPLKRVTPPPVTKNPPFFTPGLPGNPP